MKSVRSGAAISLTVSRTKGLSQSPGSGGESSAVRELAHACFLTRIRFDWVSRWMVALKRRDESPRDPRCGVARRQVH